jgi:uncharacterized damage-inducible protein DinB
MNNTLQIELWKQFGAALDMFENAITKCPPELWDDDRKFWYTAFHTLFFLDYYLDTCADDFKTYGPLNMTEAEIDEIMPGRTLTKDELLVYLKHCREKAHTLIAGFTEETLSARWIDKYRNYSMYEMQFYNMRHVQHHTGQLNMMLGHIDHDLPIWVSQTKVEL